MGCCARPEHGASRVKAKTKTPRTLRRVLVLGGSGLAEDNNLRVGFIRHEIILLNYRSDPHFRGAHIVDAHDTAAATYANALREGDLRRQGKREFHFGTRRKL